MLQEDSQLTMQLPPQLCIVHFSVPCLLLCTLWKINHYHYHYHQCCLRVDSKTPSPLQLVPVSRIEKTDETDRGSDFINLQDGGPKVR